MTTRADITGFLERLADHDGFAPLSDGKLPVDPGSERALVVSEDGRIVAVAAAADHRQHDGSLHRELETAVEPGLRFPAFEGAVLDAAMPLADAAASSSVWSQRASLDRALDERGFTARRHLDHMVVDLPVPGSAPGRAAAGIRTYTADDRAALVAVNRAAFSQHREAAALNAAEMARYEREPWFDPAGVFIVDDGAVAGFCWTRVHADGDGEIFRIAVDPRHQGSGLGRVLLHAGFDYLAGRRDVSRGTLWVDRSSVAATNLYRSIGLAVDRTNTEFTRA